MTVGICDITNECNSELYRPGAGAFSSQIPRQSGRYCAKGICDMTTKTQDAPKQILQAEGGEA